MGDSRGRDAKEVLVLQQTLTSLVTALGAVLRSTRNRFVIVLAFLAVLVQPLPAQAAWTSTATGSTTVTATAVLRGGAPTVVRSGSAVQLSWAATTLGTGRAVEGYQVRRHEGTAAPVLICTTVAPTRTCDDISPSSSPVSYGVVAIFKNWRGPESPLTPYTHDTTGPVTTLTTSPASNAGGWNSSAVTISLNATDPSGLAGVNYRINGGSTVTSGGSSVSFPVSAEGSTTVTYWSIDVFGNQETQKTHVVRIDTVAPTAVPAGLAISPDTGASSSDGITNQVALTLSGTAPAGSMVNVRVGTNLVATVTASAGGTFTAALPALSGDGLHTVTAQVVDQAGNEGPAASFGIKLDRTAPAGGVAYPTSGGAYAKGQFKNGCSIAPWLTQSAMCGTASDTAYSGGLDKASIRLVRSSDSQCWTGTATSAFSAAACAAVPTTPITGTTSPLWLALTGDPPTGGYVLTVTVRDLAGNSTVLAPVSFSMS